jgi:hypothetical protein
MLVRLHPGLYFRDVHTNVLSPFFRQYFLFLTFSTRRCLTSLMNKSIQTFSHHSFIVESDPYPA